MKNRFLIEGPSPVPAEQRVCGSLKKEISHFVRSRCKPVMILLLAISTVFETNAQVNKNYFTVENYYKIKWGFAEEFIELWKVNHYPLLKKAVDKGDIISVTAEKPKLHSGEDTRWDFKVRITFKDVNTSFDPNLTTPYKKQLYPDSAKLVKDEKRRFELLLAHWDVMTEELDLR